jgi:hypothetical protein
MSLCMEFTMLRTRARGRRLNKVTQTRSRTTGTLTSKAQRRTYVVYTWSCWGGVEGDGVGAGVAAAAAREDGVGAVVRVAERPRACE